MKPVSAMNAQFAVLSDNTYTYLHFDLPLLPSWALHKCVGLYIPCGPISVTEESFQV
jgi:hypothetical protein